MQLFKKDRGKCFEDHTSSNLGNIVEMKNIHEGNKFQTFTQKVTKDSKRAMYMK